jgi:hypothetical protein
MLEAPTFVYEVVAMMLLASLGILFFGLVLTKPLVRILLVPRVYVMPVVFVLCTVGSFAIASRLFDVWTMIGFGLLGYLLRRFDYPLAPLVLGSCSATCSTRTCAAASSSPTARSCPSSPARSASSSGSRSSCSSSPTSPSSARCRAVPPPSWRGALRRSRQPGPPVMPSIDKLSINLATVRKRWNLVEAVEGCARAGIRAVAPWRDQVAAVGLAESAASSRTTACA